MVFSSRTCDVEAECLRGGVPGSFRPIVVVAAVSGIPSADAPNLFALTPGPFPLLLGAAAWRVGGGQEDLSAQR